MEKSTNICQTCLSADRQLISTSGMRRVLRKIKCKELQNITMICWECHSIIKKFYMFMVGAKQAQVDLGKKSKIGNRQACYILRRNVAFHQLQDYKSFSKLIHTTKTNYDYVFSYNSDNIHNDTKMIKMETCEDFSEVPVIDYSDSENEKKKEQLINSIKNENMKEKLTPKKKRSLSTKSKVLKKEKRSLSDARKELIKDQRSLNGETNDYIKKKSPLNCRMKVLTKEKRVQRKKKVKDDFKEVKKFKIVMQTEEEMLRNREEKRNQPNYKKIPYKCDTCVLGFTIKANFDSHFEKKHNQDIGHHICPVCSTRFATPSSLHRHTSKHYLHYICDLCDYKAYSAKTAENHSRDKHENDELDRIHCKQCTAVLRTAAELEEHTRTEHTVFCNDCGEQFKGKHTLRSHLVRIHAVKREFVCEICTRSFLTKSRLESHITKHSQSMARQLAYCSLCRVQYKNIHIYRSHVRNSVNHARNRYQCTECSKKFASKIYWTRHYNFYHLKKSQYKCVDCNKLFISEWRLKNHKQIHHGLSRNRDHGCTECDKKFYTLSTLRAHILTHSSRREFMCHHCGDTFKQRPALYTHARLVHKIK